MRRLPLLFLLLALGAGACRRQVQVSSPTPDQPLPAAPGSPGGATAREALDRFMHAARVQDLEAMSVVWGTAAGPVRATMNRQEWEMREVYMMRCLRHDSWRVQGESPAAAGERMFVTELRYRDLTRSTNFYAVLGPSQRWFVRQVEMDQLQAICQRPI